MFARDVMLKDVVTATKDMTTKQCIELLFKRHIGSIVIVDSEQRCIGIFTERDAIRIVAQNVTIDAPVEFVMTKNLITVLEETTYQEVRKIISTHGIRHLPVIGIDGKLAGLISVRHILSELLGT